MSSQLTPEQIEILKKRPIRSFVMRRGHITEAQERALTTLFPKYEVPYQEALLNPEAVFGRKAPLVLEIGTGMGETTAAIAAAHPEVDFLGCEVFGPGVGALSMKIEEGGLKNLRICRHDAMEVVEHMIGDGMLSGVHIFFPDPWRKARHHKRRLIQPPFVSRITQKLAVGGYIHCATDWENYAEQMLEVLSGEKNLVNLHPEGFSPVQANPLCERPRTKFQARGERLGYGIWDLIFARRDPAQVPNA